MNAAASSLSIVLGLSLASVAHAGNVLVVGPTGKPYAQIQAAVDAAVNGDVILVKTGTYGSFVVGHKSIAIVGDLGSTVQVAGTIRVRNLAPSDTLVLANLSATGVEPNDLDYSCGLFLINNQGHVRIEACTFDGLVETTSCCSSNCGFTSSPQCNAGVRAESTLDLAFAGCTIHGGIAAPSSSNPSALAGSGGPGMYATGSSIALFDSIADGGNGRDAAHCSGSPGGFGGDGFLATTSTLFTSGCSLHGGKGGDVEFNLCLGPHSWGGDGGSGIQLENPAGTSSARVIDTFAQGGGGGDTLDGGCGGDCAEPGANGLGLEGSTFYPIAGGARTMSSPTPVREQAMDGVTFFGTPGDRVALLVAAAPATGTYLPGWRGVRVVEVSHPPLMLDLGTIPASGNLTASFQVPDLGPGVQSRIYYLQALFIDTQARTHLGTPSAMVVLDSAF